MSLYDRLKKSIEESEYDKKNNSITWVAQFNAKDDTDEKVVKLGIRQEGHLTWIYFDFDTNDADGCGDSDEEAIEQIERRWGYMDTFERIKG